MALIKCNECGHEMSSSATTCPHCGAPQQSNKPNNSNSKAYAIIASIVGVVSGVIAGLMSDYIGSHGGSIQEQNTASHLTILCVISLVVAIIFFVKYKNEQK